MRDSHDPRAPGAASEIAASEVSAPHPLTEADIAWLARIFAGRSPAEIAQMKAAFDAVSAAASPSERTRHALLGIVDEFDHMRALFTALDMALADIQDRTSRNALRTLSDTIHTRLQAIREDVETLRTPHPLAA